MSEIPDEDATECEGKHGVFWAGKNDMVASHDDWELKLKVALEPWLK
jgi:hypothetical protein